MTTPVRRRAVDAQIIIVGGGVVGATLALGWLRQGRSVALVEASAPPSWSEPSPDLRVYALAPDSIRLFESLGVWAGVRAARVRPYLRMRVWDAGSADELCFDADAIGRPGLGAIVEHALLVEQLWQALRRESGLIAQPVARVVDFQQDEHSASVVLDDQRRLRGEWVIAADGADSALRQLGGIAVDRQDYRQHGVVGYVDSELPHQDTAWQRFLPGGPLAMLPFADPCDASARGRRSSFVWTVPDAEANRLRSLDDAEFGETLTRAFDARLGTLRCASPRAAFPLRRQHAARYVDGRLVLAGDAAHVVHPLAGQGVNLGLRDVERLLALTASGSPISAQRLQRYERERRSDNALAAWSFDGLNRLFSNDYLLPTLLRGPALGLVNRIGPLRQLFARHALGG